MVSICSPRLLVTLSALLLAWTAMTSTATSADWPAWRGNGSGCSSEEQQLPLEWSNVDNIAWSAPLAGQGFSSPVVASGRVFLTTAQNQSLLKDAPFVVLIVGLGVVALSVISLWYGRSKLILNTVGATPRVVAFLDGAAATLAHLFYATGLMWLCRNNSLIAEGGQQTIGNYVVPVLLLGTVCSVWLAGPASRWRLAGAAAHGLAAIAFALFLIETRISAKSLVFLAGVLGVVFWWPAVFFTARRLSRGGLQATQNGEPDSPPDGAEPRMEQEAAEGSSHGKRRGRIHAWLVVCMLALPLAGILQFLAVISMPRFDRWIFSVVCLDRRDGNVLWEQVCFWEKDLRKLSQNSFATPTPAAEGNAVVAQFGAGLLCLDMDGSEIWRKPIPNPKGLALGGAAISPLLFRDMVIYAVVPDDHSPKSNDHLSADSWLAALDKATGEERWRLTLPGGHDSYGTPLITPVDDHPVLLLPTWGHLLVVDPATGELLQDWDLPICQCIPSPVADEQRAYVMAGRDHGSKGGFAVDLDLAGSDQESSIAWRTRREPADISSPVLVDGLLYMVSSNGSAQCLDAETGDIVWRERLKGMFFASVVAGDGKVYFTSDDGTTTVVRQGREYVVLATNSIDESVSASPAIAGGQLFIRGKSHLYCIGARQ